MATDRIGLFKKRRLRVRNKLRKINKNKIRLSVHRSSKNIYVQLIDDSKGATLRRTCNAGHASFHIIVPSIA